MDQQQYGGSVGGAIVPNRTFYFTNFEQRLLDQTGLTTILDQNVPIINARLAATGYPGSPITTGIYPNPVHSANILGKIDHQISGSDQLSVRYAGYHVTSDNSRGAGALNAPTASAGLANVDHAIAFGNTLTISPRTVNETRAQFTYGDLEGPTDRPHRTGRQHHRRRRRSAPPRAARRDDSTRCTNSSTTSRIRPARTRFAPAWTSSSTTTRSPIPARPAGATRSRRWRTS